MENKTNFSNAMNFSPAELKESMAVFGNGYQIESWATPNG